MCTNVLSACMPVHHICAAPVESRKGIRSVETGVTDSWKPLCECWELNHRLLRCSICT